MWVFQNHAFVSVVSHRTQRDRLLVRSRIAGDVERAVPVANVFEDPSADYRYRAIVSRDEFKRAMSDAVDRIDYDNFKGSIPNRDRVRHDAYMGVWGVMARWFGAYVGFRPRTPDEDAFPEEENDPDVEAYLRDDLKRVGFWSLP